MTLAHWSSAVAFASAVAALVVLILGVFERRRAFKAQQAELARQAERWHAEFNKDFQLEQYRQRLAAYGAVLKTLGAVPDVMSESGPDKYRALHGNEELLRSTAEVLRSQLYGEPGLLMMMSTRNSLHTAWRQCLNFMNGPGDEDAGDFLVEVFFRARRYLRADLELQKRSRECLEALVKKLD